MSQTYDPNYPEHGQGHLAGPGYTGTGGYSTAGYGGAGYGAQATAAMASPVLPARHRPRPGAATSAG